jgi:glyoxylase-like metal-dependent hydrolase (beta-lactamase superfamily II)
MKADNVIFYQLFDLESSTYTYLVGDAVSKEAALIDPVLECMERDLKLVNDLGLTLKYVLDTHVHADHITGAGEIRARTGAKSGICAKAAVDCADLALADGARLYLGQKCIVAIATPGHTNTCMSFLFEGAVFTGDALLIRATGRTDFQQGSAARLYESISKILFMLPENTMVYPGHDYNGQTSSTIGLEKKYNPRIHSGTSEAEFLEIMANLKLSDPKKMKEAVPANLMCGKKTPH